MRTDAGNQDGRGKSIFDDKTNYISAVAHEIRTPLSAIVALTDLIERKGGENLSPSQCDYLRILRLNGHRLAALIDDLLDLHRAQRGELRITRRQVDAERLVMESLETMRPLLEERGQLLDVRLSVRDVTINVDSGRISQVLLNVLSNASKYSPEGSTIHIRADATRQDVYFTVRDEGSGFDDAARDRVFEPYFRAAEDTGATIAGSGLGLAVSRSLVELHGGAIDIVSKPLGGTVVAISLPAVVASSAGRVEAPAGAAAG